MPQSKPCRISTFVAALLTIVMLVQEGRAAPDLTPPWPDMAAVGSASGERVGFPSHSPFTLTDVGAGPESDPPTEAVGVLFLPERASAAAPVPAVVMLHGASGAMSAREHVYGRQLAAMGVAALAVDTFGARPELGGGFIDRVMNITESMFLADAYAALRFLADRPDIDAGRIVLVGFSYGGMAATYAAYEQIAALFGQGRAERFAGHVAFYAPCIAEFEDNRATGAPLLMLYGARDAIIDPERCAEVAAELEAGGARVETVVYEDAVHQWDGRFAGPREIGRSLAPCHFVVRRDGSVRDRRWPIFMSSSLTRRLLLAMCADSEGYLIGRDDGVRMRSNGDFGRFLEAVFSERDSG